MRSRGSAMLSYEAETYLLNAFFKPDRDAEWSLARVSSVEQLVRFSERLMRDMSALGFPAKDLFGTRLALHEAVVNALKHGHGSDITQAVSIRYSLTPERIVLEVEDQGPGFNPSAVPNPTAAENLEKPNGRGILLMRSFMSLVRYSERGNRVTLCRFSSARAALNN